MQPFGSSSKPHGAFSLFFYFYFLFNIYIYIKATLTKDTTLWLLPTEHMSSQPGSITIPEPDIAGANRAHTAHYLWVEETGSA